MSLIHKTVRKSNALVEASYRLSVYEQRIILTCLSQIKKGGEVTDEVMYRVSAAEIAKAAGVVPQTAYQRLKEAAERLFDRRVTLYQLPNGSGPRKPLQARWIQSVRYVDAHVEVRFGKDILPYLTELSRQFTKYKFGDVAKMSSAYAVRLYELLVQWDGVGKRETEVEWLKETLQVNDKYPAMKDFKKWVLEPAVEQVNKHSPMNVTWTQKKTGRRVTHLTFSFALKQQPTKKVEKEKPKKGWFGIPAEVLEKNVREGESLQDCALRLIEERKART